MDWFQVILFDESLEDPFLTDTEFLGEIEPWELAEGKAIQNWSREYWLRCTSEEHDGELTDALQNHLGLPIYSRRLQLSLQARSITGIQFLPLKIIRSDSREATAYAIANILNTRNALAAEHSDFEVYDHNYFREERRGHISSIRRPVLRTRLLEDVDILRLVEFPPSIFVSARFREIFIREEFRGHVFREIDLIE